MKILSLSASELEGGAARAASRLHAGLVDLGVEARLLVGSDGSGRSDVLAPKGKLARGWGAARPTLDQVPQLLFASDRGAPFASAWFPDGLATRAAEIKPDLIHLHWVAKGFIQVETLPKLRRPLVWTLHDMWPFTGGCFHSGECTRYREACGACPILNSRVELDLSRWVWRRKHLAWRDLNLTAVGPSRWIAGRVAESSLFAGRRVEVIPNGLDIRRYRPFDRREARALLGLPAEGRLLLFSAVKASAHPYKGFHHLRELSRQLAALGCREGVEWVVLGAHRPDPWPDPPLPAHFLGQLHDDLTLALVNAAVDVFVAPSLQDNLPNTVIEAMACGTPCAAFRVGGIPELIENEVNGVLAPAADVPALAAGIRWILESAERQEKLGQASRQKVVREYDLTLQAQRYLALYGEILQKSKFHDKIPK